MSYVRVIFDLFGDDNYIRLGIDDLISSVPLFELESVHVEIRNEGCKDDA